jgi:hypothetical protein
MIYELMVLQMKCETSSDNCFMSMKQDGKVWTWFVYNRDQWQADVYIVITFWEFLGCVSNY